MHFPLRLIERKDEISASFHTLRVLPEVGRKTSLTQHSVTELICDRRWKQGFRRVENEKRWFFLGGGGVVGGREILPREREMLDSSFVERRLQNNLIDADLAFLVLAQR
jgi:hypothetical protein